MKSEYPNDLRSMSMIVLSVLFAALILSSFAQPPPISAHSQEGPLLERSIQAGKAAAISKLPPDAPLADVPWQGRVEQIDTSTHKVKALYHFSIGITKPNASKIPDYGVVTRDKKGAILGVDVHLTWSKIAPDSAAGPIKVEFMMPVK